MTDKQHDFKENELLANVRTHVPDFDMATRIMCLVRKGIAYENTERDELVGEE